MGECILQAFIMVDANLHESIKKQDSEKILNPVYIVYLEISSDYYPFIIVNFV